MKGHLWHECHFHQPSKWVRVVAVSSPADTTCLVARQGPGEGCHVTQRHRLLTGSVPLLPLERVPSSVHHAHSCLYPEDPCVFGFPGTESPKYVWPELPGPGEYSGRELLDSGGLGIENRDERPSRKSLVLTHPSLSGDCDPLSCPV